MRINDMKEFTVNDFTPIENSGEWRTYELNNNIKIFDKSPEGEQPLQITINNNCELSGNILKINNYIKWLTGNFKKDLIKYYNETDATNKVDDKWYDLLEIYCVSIRIEKDGKITAYIDCGDNIYKTDDVYIFSIDTEEQKIIEVNYLG